MKIEDITQPVQPLLVEKKGRPLEGKEGGFQQLLEDARARRPESQQAATSLLPEIGVENVSGPAFSIASISAPSNAADVPPTRLEAVNAAENTLGILQQYQKSLSDPHKTLKQLAPLVQSLSQEVNHLNLLANQISPADPLQRIVTELGIVSAVEIEKFGRGDYIE